MSFSGLGQSGAVTVQLAPPDQQDPEGWIQRQWDNFVELWTELLGLQHRAATIAATTPPGSPEHEIARKVVDGAAYVMSVQNKVQKWVDTYGGQLGLGAVLTAAALAVAAAAVMAVMWWCYVRYESLKKVLDGIDAGTLTPAQGSALLDQTNKPPNLNVLGGATSWLGLGAVLALGGVLYFMSRRPAPVRSNPYLAVLGANPQPPGVWSTRVLQLDYIHDDDGQPYTHAFRPGVRMQALEDGSVRLYHPNRPIWRDF